MKRRLLFISVGLFGSWIISLILGHYGFTSSQAYILSVVFSLVALHMYWSIYENTFSGHLMNIQFNFDKILESCGANDKQKKEFQEDIQSYNTEFLRRVNNIYIVDRGLLFYFISKDGDKILHYNKYKNTFGNYVGIMFSIDFEGSKYNTLGIGEGKFGYEISLGDDVMYASTLNTQNINRKILGVIPYGFVHKNLYRAKKRASRKIMEKYGSSIHGDAIENDYFKVCLGDI